MHCPLTVENISTIFSFFLRCLRGKERIQSSVYALRAWSHSLEDSPCVRTLQRTKSSARMAQVLWDGQGIGLFPTKQRSGRKSGVTSWCHDRAELQCFLSDWKKYFYHYDPRNRRFMRLWIQGSDWMNILVFVGFLQDTDDRLTLPGCVKKYCVLWGLAWWRACSIKSSIHWLL